MTEPKNKYDKLLTDFNNRKDTISIEDLKSFTVKMLESASLNEESHNFADKALHERVSELVSERNKRFSNDHKVQELEKLTGLTIGDIVSKVECGAFGIIEHNQRSISYDEAIKVVADTYEMSVDDYEHLWAKGNDYLQVDALSKEITGSSLWDHRNCNFDGFEKVEDTENETPDLTLEDIKALGMVYGTIQRLFSEGFREGFKEVSE